MTSVHDIAIVGGGPAGAAAACRLARAGRRPLLVERDPSPRHKICGEFLSVEARACLREIGIDPHALGGVPVATLRLFAGRVGVETSLPFEGVSLTRRALDEALVREAVASGAELVRGEVRDVVEEGAALRLDLSGREPIRARAVCIATGKHELRAFRRPVVAKGEALIGFKTYVALSPRQAAALEGTVEIRLFEGGYVGLQPVEGGLANLCLLASRRLFDAAGRGWEPLLAHLCEASPSLAERLDGARPHLSKPLSVSGQPYGFVHDPAPGDPGRLYRLGDQAGVIHPFAGDGVSIALYTGRLAAEAVLAGDPAEAFHARLRRDLGRQIGFASLLYQASQTWLGRWALIRGAQAVPALLRAAAARTRVSARALERAGITPAPAMMR